MQTFHMKKKHTTKSGVVIYKEVGTVVIRDSGKNGVAYLNWLDGEFALFLKDAKDEPEPELKTA